MDFSRLTDPEAYKMAMANLLRSGKSVGTAFQNEANKNYGLMDYAVAPLEVPLTVASGAVAPFLGVGKGIYQNMAQGTNNRVDNPELAQSFMYNPSSPVSQDIVSGLGNMLQQSKLPAYTPMVGTAASKAPALLRSKTESTIAAPKLDKIGQALENRRINEYRQLVNEYNKLEDAKGGLVSNTDVARELSPEYRANRTLSANVHEPASTFVKELYAEKLAQPATEGKRVLFTGGGTGAGKTNALEAYSTLKDNAEMIYDTNMNKLGSAQKKIDQALDAGRQVDLVYVYRDPVEALVQGSLKRAMRMKEEKGSGRTVPLKEHIRTHIGSRDVIGQLQEIYGDNPNVRFGIIDNRYGKDQAKRANLEDLPINDPKTIEKDLRNALEEQYKSGKIDKDIYESSK
jgi:hypothetical protein